MCCCLFVICIGLERAWVHQLSYRCHGNTMTTDLRLYPQACHPDKILSGLSVSGRTGKSAEQTVTVCVWAVHRFRIRSFQIFSFMSSFIPPHAASNPNFWYLTAGDHDFCCVGNILIMTWLLSSTEEKINILILNDVRVNKCWHFFVRTLLLIQYIAVSQVCYLHFLSRKVDLAPFPNSPFKAHGVYNELLILFCGTVDWTAYYKYPVHRENWFGRGEVGQRLELCTAGEMSSTVGGVIRPARTDLPAEKIITIW